MAYNEDAIRYITGSASDVPILSFDEFGFSSVDKKLLVGDGATNSLVSGLQIGTFANRPTAGFVNRMYYATDTVQLFADNGSTWVEIYFNYFDQASSEAESSTTSTTFQVKLSKAIGTVVTGNYLLSWYFELAGSTANKPYEGRIRNTTDATDCGYLIFRPAQSKIEAYDTCCGNCYLASFSGNKTFEIQYRSQISDTTYIRRARLHIRRVS